MKQKPAELKGEIDSSTTVTGDFNAPILNGTKVNIHNSYAETQQETEDINTINQVDTTHLRNPVSNTSRTHFLPQPLGH